MKIPELRAIPLVYERSVKVLTKTFVLNVSYDMVLWHKNYQVMDSCLLFIFIHLEEYNGKKVHGYSVGKKNPIWENMKTDDKFSNLSKGE